MQSIEARGGLKFTLEITPGDVRRKLKPIGLNLFEPVECEDRINQTMNHSIEKSMEVIWELVKDQASECPEVLELQEKHPEWDLSECFWELLSAEQLNAALLALSEEIVFFTRSLSLIATEAEVFGATKRKAQKLREVRVRKLADLYESPQIETKVEEEIDRRMEEALKNLEADLRKRPTELPAPSALTPTDTTSATSSG